MIHTYVCIIILSFFITINQKKKKSQDKILKNKNKERSEANDGEAYALVYGGRGGAFTTKLGATPFSSVFGS